MLEPQRDKSAAELKLPGSALAFDIQALPHAHLNRFGLWKSELSNRSAILPTVGTQPCLAKHFGDGIAAAGSIHHEPPGNACLLLSG